MNPEQPREGWGDRDGLFAATAVQAAAVRAAQLRQRDPGAHALTSFAIDDWNIEVCSM